MKTPKFLPHFLLLAILLITTACGSENISILTPIFNTPPKPTLTPAPIPASTISPLPTFTVSPTPAYLPAVLVDTDMALDDWMAVLFLLRHPDIDVIAITISGSGETHCSQGVDNAIGLVALAQHTPIPVACGQESPLQGEHVFPQDWRNAADNLLGLSLPQGINPIEPGIDAPTLIARSAQSGRLTILTLGPLTNLAAALQTDPTLAERIAQVYIMGGAVDVSGNLPEGGTVNNNTTAEWNFYIDPQAANIVLRSGARIRLIPLDATNEVPLTLDFYQQLGSSQDTPASTFIYQVLTQIYDIVAAGSYYFWDPLAAAVLTEETLVQFTTRHLCVETAEGPNSGSLYTNDTCPSIQAAIHADQVRFKTFFLQTLHSKTGLEHTPATLAGKWSGTAHNGDLTFTIVISLQKNCVSGQVCGHFEIFDFACSGDYRLAEIDGKRFRFTAENQSSACTPGSEDWLELLPDGTLRYTSSHPSYGQSQGILTNK